CWGYGAEGELGNASRATIGDDEAPGSVAPVDLGPGRTARAIAAGDFHTCALLDDDTVRCWGFGADGRLGYGAEANVGDDETPGSLPPVDLGAGRTARAITAGAGHTCALLDDASVRCWGYGENGALGYGNADSIGDDEPPASAGPVRLGAGRTAVAVSAGNDFTCVVLDDGTVRCWGLGLDGRLGYGNTARVGDDEQPDSVGPVDLGAGRTASAISAGAHGTCAVLDDASLRCWGEGREGQLGYGDGKYIGDNETPGSVGPVDLGPGRTAEAVSAGRHTCAVLNLGALRCWGANRFGQLGYGHTASIGETETPAAAGPVDLGAGRSAMAVGAAERHTCARLDDDSVRCWGFGGAGRLGLCDERTIGDDEPPAAVAPVPLLTAHCPPR
ncbi:MAG: chromosome condensation regulator, partial [Actinobacteria bacterium]|nr:chromosome condensation regulator [Actinomycetota bacterium]